MPASNFHFDGQHVFLTYPQCAELSRERVRDFFVEKTNCDKFFVALERHADGGRHVHAYFHWERRRRFVGADCFDVDGHHPNISRPRSAKHVIAYCAKEDDSPLANFEPGSEVDEGGGWGELLHSCTNADEFLRGVRERYPRNFVIDNERIRAFCKWHFKPKPVAYVGRRREEFSVPIELDNWVDNILNVSRVASQRLGATAPRVCGLSVNLWGDPGRAAPRRGQPPPARDMLLIYDSL